MKNKNSNKLNWITFILIFFAIIFISTKINNNINHDIGSLLPDYDLKEIETVEKDVEMLQNDKTVSFSFITDLHINNENNLKNNMIAFANISNNKMIKFAAVGGDLYSAYETNYSEGTEYIKSVYSFFHDKIDKYVYYTKGNHDCNAKLDSNEYIKNEDYYNLVIKDIENNIITNPNDKYGGYYYKDLDEENIRICVLNSFEGEGQEYIFNDEELRFIANTMLNFENKLNPENWQVLFIAHTAAVKQIEEFNDIIYAYQNGEKVKFKNYETDFSKQGKGNVIALITGHAHIDSSNYDNDYLTIIVQRGFNLQEEIGTKDELCFSIFTIDTEKHILYETRCGRGESRQWNYNDEIKIQDLAA